MGARHGGLPDPDRLRRQRLRRGRRAAWLVALPVFGALVGATAYRAQGARIASFLRGEIDLRGEPRLTIDDGEDADQLQAVDMERVHGELLPAWVIAHNHRLESPAHFRRAESMRQALLAALEPAPNLAALAEELTTLVGRDPIANLRRLDYLGWSWNAYLERERSPYRLELSMMLGHPPVLLSASYRVIEESGIGVGGEQFRARLLWRLDPTNVRETYLGHTGRSEDGALILGERLMDFTVRHLWPALDPSEVRGDGVRGAFAAALGQAVTDALPEEHVHTLRQTAPTVRRLADATRAVNERRACGSRFRVREITWRGISQQDEEALFDAVVDGADGDCPEVSLGEAIVLAHESKELASRDGLAPAVAALTAWAARAIAVHEAQHAADELHEEAAGKMRPCPGCPDWLRASGRAELSAYMASYGSDDAWAVALYQACLLPADVGGAHEAAQFVARRELLPEGCEGTIPPDLPFRARRLSRDLFGAHAPVRVPEGFGEHLAAVIQ